ncbi:uncharacterized protein LOC127563119 isoform X5 [Antechinus flavipes]|uniref:uncharacterized protein LOC127563119 isoform X5 n=1 Tax=Antechinus flavipes TaxID=38775 RepID=UPI0022366B9E|nr:uncharacterized protein LOC127563119 isoform X5 [Antechinus flavipes]
MNTQPPRQDNERPERRPSGPTQRPAAPLLHKWLRPARPHQGQAPSGRLCQVRPHRQGTEARECPTCRRGAFWARAWADSPQEAAGAAPRYIVAASWLCPGYIVAEEMPRSHGDTGNRHKVTQGSPQPLPSLYPEGESLGTRSVPEMRSQTGPGSSLPPIPACQGAGNARSTAPSPAHPQLPSAPQAPSCFVFYFWGPASCPPALLFLGRGPRLRYFCGAASCPPSPLFLGRGLLSPVSVISGTWPPSPLFLGRSLLPPRLRYFWGAASCPPSLLFLGHGPHLRYFWGAASCPPSPLFLGRGLLPPVSVISGTRPPSPLFLGRSLLPPVSVISGTRPPSPLFLGRSLLPPVSVISGARPLAPRLRYFWDAAPISVISGAQPLAPCLRYFWGAASCPPVSVISGVQPLAPRLRYFWGAASCPLSPLFLRRGLLSPVSVISGARPLAPRLRYFWDAAVSHPHRHRHRSSCQPLLFSSFHLHQRLEGSCFHGALLPSPSPPPWVCDHLFSLFKFSENTPILNTSAFLVPSGDNKARAGHLSPPLDSQHLTTLELF